MIRIYFKNFFSSPFHHNWQIVTVWISVSYILLAINSGWGFFGVILSPEFPVAMLFTCTVAALLTIYIYTINQLMEKQFPYRQCIKKRLFMQLMAGIILPIGFELLFASAYFFFKNSGSLLSNGFFDIDFILIVTFILLLNGFYMYALDIYQYKLGMENHLADKIHPALEELALLKKMYRLKKIREVPVSISAMDLIELDIIQNQIACVYKIDKKIVIHYFDNRIEFSKKPVSWHYAPLTGLDYILINPACFYHRLVIFDWETIGPSRRLRLILRHPFNHLNLDTQRIVSQGNSRDFRTWFEQNDLT